LAEVEREPCICERLGMPVCGNRCARNPLGHLPDGSGGIKPPAFAAAPRGAGQGASSLGMHRGAICTVAVRCSDRAAGTVGPAEGRASMAESTIRPHHLARVEPQPRTVERKLARRPPPYPACGLPLPGAIRRVAMRHHCPRVSGASPGDVAPAPRRPSRTCARTSRRSRQFAGARRMPAQAPGYGIRHGP